MKNNTIVGQNHHIFNCFLMLDVQRARSIYLLILNLNKTKVKHIICMQTLCCLQFIEENIDLRCSNKLNGAEDCRDQVIFYNFIE